MTGNPQSEQNQLDPGSNLNMVGNLQNDQNPGDSATNINMIANPVSEQNEGAVNQNVDIMGTGLDYHFQGYSNYYENTYSMANNLSYYPPNNQGGINQTSNT